MTSLALIYCIDIQKNKEKYSWKGLENKTKKIVGKQKPPIF